MLPDDTLLDLEHEFACKLTPTEPAVAAPSVRPVMVTVNAEVLTAAPRSVMTTAVVEVEPQVAVKLVTLLAPEATLGTTDGAKKLEG